MLFRPFNLIYFIPSIRSWCKKSIERIAIQKCQALSVGESCSASSIPYMMPRSWSITHITQLVWRKGRIDDETILIINRLDRYYRTEKGDSEESGLCSASCHPKCTMWSQFTIQLVSREQDDRRRPDLLDYIPCRNCFHRCEWLLGVRKVVLHALPWVLSARCDLKQPFDYCNHCLGSRMR